MSQSRYTAACTLVCFLFGSLASYADRVQFTVKEAGPNLEVISPWGTKTYVSGTRLDVMKNYRISIPLKDLMPVGATIDSDDWFNNNEWAKNWMDEWYLETFNEEPAPVAAVPTDEPTRQPLSVEVTLPKPTPVVKPPADIDNNSQIEAPVVDDTGRLVMEANRFYHQGKYYEALLYVDEVIRKKPSFVRGYVMKGSLLYLQGHKDLAKETWQSVLKFNAENQEIKDLLQRFK